MTQEKNKHLPQKDFEWCLFENANIASFLKTLKCVQPKRELSFNKILERVKKERIIRVFYRGHLNPGKLKHYRRDFSNIIENTDILRQDIGL